MCIDQLGIGGTQVLLVNLCMGDVEPHGAIGHEVLALHSDGAYIATLRAAGIPVRSLDSTRCAINITPNSDCSAVR